MSEQMVSVRNLANAAPSDESDIRNLAARAYSPDVLKTMEDNAKQDFEKMFRRSKELARNPTLSQMVEMVEFERLAEERMRLKPGRVYPTP